MKFSKDQTIKIVMAIVIVILVTLLITKNNDNEDVNLEFGDKLTEEISDEDGEVAEEKTTTPTPTKTTTTTTTTTTSTPSPSGCYPGLSGKKLQSPKGISLAWTGCTSDNFQFYKLVKSSINSNPNYPNDPVVMSSTNRSASSFFDTTLAPHTTYYYRVCVIERLGKVTCGNSVSVTY